MSDTNIDDLFAGDDEKPKRKPRAAAKPKPEAKVKAESEPIDNAVNIRRLDWECVCGNTNTLDLQLCGKCRSPRFTTN